MLQVPSLPPRWAHLQHLSGTCQAASQLLTRLLPLLQVADFATLVGTYARGFAIITEPFDQRMENVRDPVMQVRVVTLEGTDRKLSASSVLAPAALFSGVLPSSVTLLHCLSCPAAGLPGCQPRHEARSGQVPVSHHHLRHAVPHRIVPADPGFPACGPAKSQDDAHQVGKLVQQQLLESLSLSAVHVHHGLLAGGTTQSQGNPFKMLGAYCS